MILNTLFPAVLLNTSFPRRGCLALCFLLSGVNHAYAAPVKEQSVVQRAADRQQEKAVHERIKNRAKLLKKVKQQPALVPLTPVQLERELVQKQTKRRQNREQLAMHTRWKPGQLGGSDRLLPLATEDIMAGMRDPDIEVLLNKVMQQLKLQLGKPYVWGGETPKQGFDCSGLIYYVYNQILNRKLPRTTNEMYRDPHLRHVKQGELRRGDLIFFRIKTQHNADHVGVYLGDGQFIEAPRTGKNVRISQLTDNFWQDHYLGAKRALTKDRIGASTAKS